MPDAETTELKAIATVFSPEHLTISETFLHSVVEFLKSDKRKLKGYSISETWDGGTSEHLKVEIGEISIAISMEKPK